MSIINLTYHQAESINQTIDRYHQPSQWVTLGVMAGFFALEVFLPTKEVFESKFDRYYSYVKFGIIVLMTSVALSQGITGGCVVQIPQNWLARTYMGKEYWYPFGVVFRENFPTWFEPYLRLIYFVFSLITPYTVWIYWKKRIKIPRLTWKNSLSKSNEKVSEITTN